MSTDFALDLKADFSASITHQSAFYVTITPLSHIQEMNGDAIILHCLGDSSMIQRC